MSNTIAQKSVLSVSDVAYICKLAKAERERTRGEAYAIVQACDRRLKQASEGTLELASDVRLPLDGLVRVLWKLRKQALAQWKAAKAAEEAAAVEEAEAQFLAEYREALAYEHAAEVGALDEAE